MRPTRRSLVLWGAVLISGLISTIIGINAGQEPKKVRVIYTNDTMGYLESCG